ncbi:MAG: 2-amino-4-hydroxy-6-hydroxymethyldihydropteridine diphosphokinase [Bacteroidetes bacterium]|nr:2-amino-4-hydroxy-6-hydroxymethyldihydropteridine diphosphokinase [Bacteroidota bacterium]
MNQAVLLLGSNLGDTFDNLSQARLQLSRQTGKINLASSLYETLPWGFKHENNFLNQVLVLETEFGPLELLNRILKIEEALGRHRDGQGYQARVIDIDILYYNKEIIEDEFLKVPHPLLHERRFTLAPLTEVLPDFIHPVFKEDNKSLLRKCKDNSKVIKVNGL